MEMIKDIKNIGVGQCNNKRAMEVIQHSTHTIWNGSPKRFREGIINSNNGRRCGKQEIP
jgi:hypothetical protein